MSRLHEMKKSQSNSDRKKLYERLDNEAESKFSKTANIKMINQLKKAKK
jgi:hypothetical protein